MNTLASRLTAAMLAVALLALLAFGGALLAAFQVAGRDVPRVARGGLGGPPPPGALGPVQEQVGQERAGRRVFDALVQTAVRATVLGLLAAAIVGTLVALWLARGLARPIASVGLAAQRVARGQLGARAPPPRAGDPAESRALIAHFNAMTASLERTDVARRALFADVAHELRTPIGAMRARLESLQDGLVPLDLSQVDRLHAQTVHLTRLVEDVRTLSLADAGELKLERRPVDVRRVLEEVAAQYAPLLQGRRQQLQLDLGDHLGRADWDAARVTQMLGNLLDNAAKASPQGGWIELSATRAGNEIKLRVVDNGAGLSEEALAHAFDRFYKADAGGQAGSGLGLAIVRALANLHGGRVSAGPHAGGGAEFSVTLPATPPAS